jgi:phenylalanyl-tRNA synthetase beta chain
MLAGLGYQETINFSFVEERWERELAGNADPIRLLNPIASQMSVMRSSPAGFVAAGAEVQHRSAVPSACACSNWAGCSCAMPRCANTDTTVQGYHQPMRVAGLAYGGVDLLQWGRKEQAVDFFDVKGDVEACWRR